MRLKFRRPMAEKMCTELFDPDRAGRSKAFNPDIA